MYSSLDAPVQAAGMAINAMTRRGSSGASAAAALINGGANATAAAALPLGRHGLVGDSLSEATVVGHHYLEVPQHQHQQQKLCGAADWRSSLLHHHHHSFVGGGGQLLAANELEFVGQSVVGWTGEEEFNPCYLDDDAT